MQYSQQRLRTPLTPQESMSVIERQRLVRQWTNTVGTVAENEPGYAGSWIDQKDGTILVFAFAGNSATKSFTRINKLLPTSARVKFVHHKYTYKELESNQSRLMRDFGTSMLVNGIQTMGVMEVTNTVDVYISVKVPESKLVVLRAKYPAPIRFIRVPDDGFKPQSSRLLKNRKD